MNQNRLSPWRRRGSFLEASQNGFRASDMVGVGEMQDNVELGGNVRECRGV